MNGWFTQKLLNGSKKLGWRVGLWPEQTPLTFAAFPPKEMQIQDFFNIARLGVDIFVNFPGNNA